MTAYSVYKLIHLIGIFSIFAALGGVALHAANGAVKADNRLRALVGMLHGLGSLLVVVAGFGMLAGFDLSDGAFPFGWVMVKVIIWLLLSITILFPYQRPGFARYLLILLPLFGGIAAALAIFKPF